MINYCLNFHLILCYFTILLQRRKVKNISKWENTASTQAVIPTVAAELMALSLVKKKTAVLRFPADEQECSAWLKAIPLKKEINVKTSVLCERHWTAVYPTISKKGKLRPRNPPSLWPEHPHILPPSCHPNPPSKPRPLKRSSFAVRSEQPDELSQFMENDRVKIEDITERVCASSEPFCCPTTAYKDGERLVIQSKARSQDVPLFVVEIEQDLKFVAFHMGIKVRDEPFDFFQLTFTISVSKHSACHALMKITFIDADFFRQ